MLCCVGWFGSFKCKVALNPSAVVPMHQVWDLMQGTCDCREGVHGDEISINDGVHAGDVDLFTIDKLVL